MVHAPALIDAVLLHTPAQPAFRRRAARRLAVLAYHDIRDPDRFARHLEHIRRFAQPVSLEAVIGAANGTSQLPPRAALVTFDDGHRDLIDVAMPMLRERGVPAAAFVVAGLLETDAPHWWTEVKELVNAGGTSPTVSGLAADDAVRALKRVPDDVRLASIAALRATARRSAPAVRQLTGRDLRELESAGIAVGNHSLTHPCLSTCDDVKIKEEIERSHEILTAALGHEPEAFAYPDGDSDGRVSEAVEAAGYRAAFLFDHRLSPASPPEPLSISRLRVDADAELDRFRIIVSGLHPFVCRVRGI